MLLCARLIEIGQEFRCAHPGAVVFILADFSVLVVLDVLGLEALLDLYRQARRAEPRGVKDLIEALLAELAQHAPSGGVQVLDVGIDGRVALACRLAEDIVPQE